MPWLDEAAANWIAYHGLSGRVSLEDYGKQDLNFPMLQFPNSFVSGYNTEQQYAAGAFLIWLADPVREGPAVVRQLYQKLGSLTDHNPDAYPILEEVTGNTMENLIRDFSFDFWTQAFAPVNQRWLPWVVGRWSDWPGLTLSDSRPPLSSAGYVVAPEDSWRPTIASREGVVRAYDLGMPSRFGFTGFPNHWTTPRERRPCSEPWTSSTQPLSWLPLVLTPGTV